MPYYPSYLLEWIHSSSGILVQRLSNKPSRLRERLQEDRTLLLCKVRSDVLEVGDVEVLNRCISWTHVRDHGFNEIQDNLFGGLCTFDGKFFTIWSFVSNRRHSLGCLSLHFRIGIKQVSSQMSQRKLW
jgi:hypothetical protein